MTQQGINISFFKRRDVNDTEKPSSVSRIYVFKVTLEDGTVLHKVGKSSGRSSKVRMLSVLESFFDKFRYIPHCKIRRDKVTVAPFTMESHLHELLSEYRYKFDKKFSGYSEFFSDINEDTLLEYIDALSDQDLLLDSKPILITEYEAICALKKPLDSVIDLDDKIPPGF